MPKLIGSGKMVKSSFNLASILSTVILSTIAFVILSKWVSGILSIVIISLVSLGISILIFRDRFDVVSSFILFSFREWKTDSRVKDTFQVHPRELSNLNQILVKSKHRSEEVE